jgi:periplasmic protein TonB
MSYQALLFCPDEKTARTVTQILGELDFNVTACTEPFAAVKKFMGERFDAVVVDCENEQNATLLFKSARSAPNNQGALAVAVVEGQAGVAKAFRIGANLVLTKPINVEQTKGTLRVARGLLRKNEAAKPANGSAMGTAPPKSSAASPVPGKPASQPPTPGATETRTVPAATSAVPTNVIPTSNSSVQPSTVASTAETVAPISESALSGKSLHDEELGSSPSSSSTTDVSFPAKIPVATEIHPQGNLSSSFAASAPAPAREPKASPSAESVRISEPAEQEITTDSKDHAVLPAKVSASTHTLTFGGTVGSSEKAKSSGKSALIGAVAVILIAASGYAAWMKWNSLESAARTPASVTTRPTPTPAPVVPAPAPQSAPPIVETQTSDLQTAVPPSLENQKTEIQKPAKSAKPEKHPAKEIAPGKESKEDALAENTLPASASPAAPQPIVIKSDNGKPTPKPAENADAPAPAVSMTGIAPSGEALPKLDPAVTATPVLQRLVISQGVSRGLLVKAVQPVYPPTALAMRVEGSVQLMATIAKTGSISEVKAVSGDKELARAALDAVKQWKYKPYLLNGEPVEIQTQITVNFKLPE